MVEALVNSESQASEQSAKQHLAAIAERILAFRREIKPDLTEAINAYLRTQTPETSDEKKILAEQVSKLLSGLNFAIDHDGRPCSLYILSGPRDPQGRFRIQPSSSKSAIGYAKTAADLVPLHLCDLSKIPDFLGNIGLESVINDGAWATTIQKNQSRGRTP